VASEDSERPYGRESRNHDAVDRDVDDRRLPTVGRIEPAVLVGLARSSRARAASPGPELGKVESRSASEPAHNGTLRSRRLSERREQGEVLAPIRKKHRPFQSRPAHENVVRSRCRSRRRQDQRQSDDRQYAHTGHVPQLHRRKPRGSPGTSHQGSRRRYVTRGVTTLRRRRYSDSSSGSPPNALERAGDARCLAREPSSGEQSGLGCGSQRTSCRTRQGCSW
jgi:hypothetical protein